MTDRDAIWAAAEAQRKRDEDELAPVLRRMYEEQRMAVLAAIDAGPHIQIEAMALNVPVVEGHPNRMPFTGILTRIGVPSNLAPGGSGGKRTLITMAAARAALPSLLSMPIDFSRGLTKHDKHSKIGSITAATIEGDAIVIGGDFWSEDFPAETARIQAMSSEMGFSFEASRIQVVDRTADPWVITGLVFTGAAVLKKAAAAYQTTSLAASAEEEAELSEATDKILAAIGKIDADLKAEIKTLTDDVAKLKSAPAAGTLEASQHIVSMVKPHADKLHACADGMQAAGIGGDPTNGHAAMARRMAGHLMAAAAGGTLAQSYPNQNMAPSGSTSISDISAAADKAAVDAAVAAATKDTTDKLAAQATQIADLTVKLTTLSASGGGTERPARKTWDGTEAAMLTKFGIDAPAEGKKLSVVDVDRKLEAAGASTRDQLAAKIAMQKAGLL